MTYTREGWLQDLESGKFEQTRNAMKRIDPFGQVKYCCLGVAGEGAGCEFRRSYPDAATFFLFDSERNGDLSGSLPEAVRDQLGLGLGDCGTLATLNDQARFSFNDIAEFVRDADRVGDTLSKHADKLRRWTSPTKETV